MVFGLEVRFNQPSSHKNLGGQDVRVVKSMIIFSELMTILKYHYISWTWNIVTCFYNNISRYTSLWSGEIRKERKKLVSSIHAPSDMLKNDTHFFAPYFI